MLAKSNDGTRLMSKVTSSAIAGATLMIAATISCVHAQEVGDPFAIVKKMSADFGSEQRVSIVTTSLYDEPFENTFIKTTVKHRSEILRPNKLITQALFDDGSRWVVSFDGERLRTYNFRDKEFSEIPFSGDLNDLADFMDDNGLSNTPLVDYMRDNFAEAIAETGTEVTLIDGYVEPGKDKMTTHHFLFESPGTDWQLWVEESDKSLPSRLVLEYDSFGRPEYLLTFDGWKFGAAAGDISQTIQMPSDLTGWKQVEFKNPVEFGNQTEN